MKWLTFLVYTIAWQSFVWGACWWLLFAQGWSAWWVALAIFMSAAQYRPSAWSELGR